jgi:hypothetical protein
MKEYLIGDKSRGQRFQLFLELLRRVTDRSLQSQSSCRPPCITFIRPAQAFLGGILHLLRYMMRYCTRWNDCLPQRLVGAFCHVSSPALTKRLNLPLSYGGCGTVVLHLVSCILHLASCILPCLITLSTPIAAAESTAEAGTLLEKTTRMERRKLSSHSMLVDGTARPPDWTGARLLCS